MSIQINQSQRLFIIPCGSGYSTLGFDVCHSRNIAIRKELNLPAPVAEIGTKDSYNEYQEAINLAKQSGKRLVCGLHSRLIGLEGKRIEATIYGERTRFIVGKSTGFIPCHLMIPNSRSHDGSAISENAELGEIKIIK